MNEAIALKLKQSIQSPRAMHGYLITGSAGDAVRLCEECAAILLFGSETVERLPLSPDYFRLDGSAKVDAIRSIRKELQTRIYSGDSRAIVIENAHLLNDNANNAMLKMLEEPPDGTFFFLTGEEFMMLPTIRSRLNVIRLGQPSRSDIEKSLSERGATLAEAETYAKQSCGDGALAEKLFLSEETRTLRAKAIGAILRALSGELDFSQTKALGENRETALTSIRFMFGVCHDLIELKAFAFGGAEIFNSEHEANLASLAGNLSVDTISRAVSALTLAQKRLTPAARPQQILDKLLIDTAVAVRNTASS